MIKKYNKKTVIVLALFFLYLISVLRLITCKATVNSIAWWTLLLLIISFIIYKYFIKLSNATKIDVVGILSIIIAGLLTLQLNQPLFSPTISEYKKIDDRKESCIYWPRDDSEKFTMDDYIFSNYELTVLSPLFPLVNKLILNELNPYEVYDVVSEIKGPIACKKDKGKTVIYTACDGFTIKSAKIYFKTKTKIPFQDHIEININKYKKFSWVDLTNNELDYLSENFFSSRVNLFKYLHNNAYKIQMQKMYNLDIEGNEIYFEKDGDGNFFELEYCELELINKSKENLTFMFSTKGFYPRDFFIRTSSNLAKQSILTNLPSGFIDIDGNQKIFYEILEVKYRRLFDEIFPINK